MTQEMSTTQNPGSVYHLIIIISYYMFLLGSEEPTLVPTQVQGIYYLYVK